MIPINQRTSRVRPCTQSRQLAEIHGARLKFPATSRATDSSSASLGRGANSPGMNSTIAHGTVTSAINWCGGEASAARVKANQWRTSIDQRPMIYHRSTANRFPEAAFFSPSNFPLPGRKLEASQRYPGLSPLAAEKKSLPSLSRTPYRPSLPPLRPVRFAFVRGIVRNAE